MMVLLTAGLSVVPGAPSGAGQPHVGLRLLSASPELTAVRYGDGTPVVLYQGLYAAATGGTFELDAITGRDGVVSIYPTRRDGGSVSRGPALHTPGKVSIAEGVPGFFRMTITDGSGTAVTTAKLPFCPAGWFSNQRVDGSGPDQPTFPYFCGSQLTRAMIYGIDHGWSSTLFVGFSGSGISDGDYHLTVAIEDTYVRQLHLDPAQSTVSVLLHIVTQKPDCFPGFPCPPPPPPGGGGAARPSVPVAGPQSPRPAERQGRSGPTGADGGDGLPNLAALPAHNLSIDNGVGRRDYLNFGATLWNAGPGPLVLEGFRRGGSTMTATQFIYRNGKPVRSQVVGSFEFDMREGHNHWHVEDAAQYDLLDASASRVLLSGKQSFCLAPTDPVDLTLPGAEWQPDRTGLWSQCAGQDSIWLRESMPAGWGDTYYQNVAGQSFDITAVPNGTYRLRVTTNPFHRLLETDYSDNTSLLTVHLGGTTGHRTFTVG